MNNQIWFDFYQILKDTSYVSVQQNSHWFSSCCSVSVKGANILLTDEGDIKLGKQCL